jgi:predicted Zn-dependent peptidase
VPVPHTVEEVTLANGAKGLLIDTPGSTMMRFECSFRAGILHVDDRRYSQVAHVLEHMALGANRQFDSAETFDRELTKNGAVANATTDDEDIVYEAVCAEMETIRILHLMGVAIAEPRFTDQALISERENVREELRSDLNGYERALTQGISRALGLHGWHDSYELSTLDAISLPHVENHYARTHTADNLRFVITGPMGSYRGDILHELNSWPLVRGERLTVCTQQLSRPTKPIYICRTDMNTVYFQFCMYVDRKFTSIEMTVLTVLRAILVNTYYSRIYGKARSQGLSYDIGANFQTYHAGISEFIFEGEVTESKSLQLFMLITNQLREVAEGGITERELIDATQLLLGRHQLEYPTGASISDWYSGDYFENDEIDPMQNYPTQLSKVTLGSITQLARELLTSGVWAFGVVGSLNEKTTMTYYDIFAKLMERR